MKWPTLFLQIAFCLSWAGCGAESSLPRFAVEGNVTLDGVPLELAQIRFMPTAAGHDAMAPIVEGRFELGDSNGPTAGEQVVLVIPYEPELEQAVRAMQIGDRDPLRALTVPVRYQTPGVLRATVRSQDRNHFQFDLSTH